MCRIRVRICSVKCRHVRFGSRKDRKSEIDAMWGPASGHLLQRTRLPILAIGIAALVLRQTFLMIMRKNASLSSLQVPKAAVVERDLRENGKDTDRVSSREFD